MKSRILRILLAVMLALSIGLIACGQPPTPAIVSESEGNLSVMKEGTANWVEAEIGMALEPTDIVKCGSNSSAEITFLDGSTVELEAGTVLEVVSLDISTETDSITIRLKLTIGSIIFRVVKIIDPASRYEVETPTGEVGIRGSAVQITVSEDGTTWVCNLEGDIWTIAQGVELQVPEGECCVIRSGQPPELVVIFPDPNLEAAIREAIAKRTGDIYPSDLEGLTSLNATEKNITDLTGLELCTGLTELRLSSNQITDVSPLASLTSLIHLDLQANEISDISPISSLTNLTHLNLGSYQLGGNLISDIKPLSTLVNLNWLYLSSNQITDISPLASLTNLTFLHAWNNQISDISALRNLVGLTNLCFHFNQIDDISPLANLTGLTVLGLHENRIRDISPLAELANLEILFVSANQISDISPLAQLTNLKILGMRTNQIRDILPLATLTSLEHLFINDNQISDISPLADLHDLTTLWLFDNQISDIHPLVENQGLSDGDLVNLEGNPLSEVSINTYVPQLEARGVRVLY